MCHYIGVPLITTSLLGLLDLVPAGPFTVSMILVAAVGAWAVVLDWRFGSIFAAAAVALYLIGRPINPWVNAGFFVIGWIFQLVGHYKYEGNSPALKDNLLQILIGPMWILARLLKLVN
jgi:uncharacterized membrane protein YGL010W